MELKKDRTFSIWLSLINQVAAILVVILHQYNILEIEFPRNLVITFISHGICTAAVPTFFFLSGYLFWNDACDWRSIKSKLKRRVFTIFLPFIIWNSIYALFFILCGKSWTEINLSEIVSSVFLYKYYFPMWFLFQLMIYFALSPLLFYLLLKAVNVNTLVISSIVILSVVSLFFRNSISFEFNGFERTIIQFNFLIYFLFGLWLSKQKIIISKITLPNLWILIILFFLSSFFSSLLFDGYIDVFYKRLFVPLVFLSFMLMMLKIAQIWHTGKLSLLGGVAPISLYFIHGLSGILLINICEYIGWQNSLFRYFFLCIGSISLSILCAKFLKELFPKVYKILCGNR